MPNEPDPSQSPSAYKQLLALAAAGKDAREKEETGVSQERRVRDELLLNHSHDLRTRAQAVMSDEAFGATDRASVKYRHGLREIQAAADAVPADPESKKLADDARHELKMMAGAEARALGKERTALRRLTAQMRYGPHLGGDVESTVASNLGFAEDVLGRKSHTYERIRQATDQRVSNATTERVEEPNSVEELKAKTEKDQRQDAQWLEAQQVAIRALIPKLEALFFDQRLTQDERELATNVKCLRENIDRCNHPKKTGFFLKKAMFLQRNRQNGWKEFEADIGSIPALKREYVQYLEAEMYQARQRYEARKHGAEDIFREVLGEAETRLNNARHVYNSIDERRAPADSKKWLNQKAHLELIDLLDGAAHDRLVWLHRAKSELEWLFVKEIKRVAGAWFQRNFEEKGE